MKNRKTIAIIPARGGSKRLPKKNSLELIGKSLIEYSIEFAKNNHDKIDEIIVTTDDKVIKEIALKHNVKVIDRPKELSGNTATTVSALKHTLEVLDNEFEHVILLQPTNPCRPSDLLKNALKVYLESDSESLMTVSRNKDKLGKIEDGCFQPYNYQIGQRSQDLEPLYFENGLLYICKTALIFSDKIFGKKNLPYIVNHPYAKVDIDTEEDFKYAEFILTNYPNE